MFKLRYKIATPVGTQKHRAEFRSPRDRRSPRADSRENSSIASCGALKNPRLEARNVTQGEGRGGARRERGEGALIMCRDFLPDRIVFPCISCPGAADGYGLVSCSLGDRLLVILPEGAHHQG